MIINNPFSQGNLAEPIWLKRFVDKIDIRADDECWLWTGSQWGFSRDGEGYGSFYLGKTEDGKRITKKSHKLAWELANGTIPKDKSYILHKCDVRNCCNPRHLSAGTHDENMKDMARKGRAKGLRLGESHEAAILTNVDADEIPRLYRDTKMTLEEIAKLKGVKKSTVSNIIGLVSWKHIEIDEKSSRPIIRDLRELPNWIDALWTMQASDLHPRNEIGKRVIAIRDSLTDGQYHTAIKMAESLGVNPATISRTAKYLIQSGKVELKKAVGYRLRPA